jgi:hypothetical protein
MKITNLLIISVSLIVFLGCKNQGGMFIGKSKYGLKFEQEYVMPSGENPVLELLPGGQAIYIIDTLLLAQHRYENPSYHWDIYNLNNLTHLKSILRNGRGPDEVLFSDYAGQYEKINNEIWMYFFDLNSARFLKINLNQSIQSGGDIIELISPINPQNSPYFVIDNDSFIYSNYSRNEGSISLIKSDNSWRNSAIYKNIYREMATNDYYKLRYSLLFNKKNRKMCLTPSYIDQIQIIDLENNNDMVLSTAKSNNWETIRQEDVLSATVFYTTTRITDDLIFTLRRNQKVMELENTPKDTEVHIFNWAGDAIAKIRLADFIVSFDVDMKNKILYGLDNIERLYAYDISSCLDYAQQRL